MTVGELIVRLGEFPLSDQVILRVEKGGLYLTGPVDRVTKPTPIANDPWRDVGRIVITACA